jgi:hypothetical protein
MPYYLKIKKLDIKTGQSNIAFLNDAEDILYGVHAGDKIKISMNTSDANNDKVSIFWGLTTRNKDNTLSFKLLDESDNDLIYIIKPKLILASLP